jgi:hypothetical protein
VIFFETADGAHTVFIPLVTRADFIEMPLNFVLLPALDGPRLAFREEDEALAATMQQEIYDWRAPYLKAKQRRARQRIRFAVMKTHRALCHLAIGWCLVSDPRRIYAFAEDDDHDV